MIEKDEGKEKGVIILTLPLVSLKPKQMQVTDVLYYKHE